MRYFSPAGTVKEQTSYPSKKIHKTPAIINWALTVCNALGYGIYGIFLIRPSKALFERAAVDSSILQMQEMRLEELTRLLKVICWAQCRRMNQTRLRPHGLY
jgi:formate/nitrite transporter FocA (FNT family)